MKEKGHISLIIIMASLSLFCCYHIYYYFLDKGSNDLIRDYYYSDNTSISESKQLVKKMNIEEKEEYLGILKIPKINLRQGFYNVNSKNNDVSKNITILKESTMPSIDGSIIYLVAHSGYGYLAYFKDLNKLGLDDQVYLDMNHHTYQYVVSDIYEIEKNGKIIVNHNIHDNYLILSTCSNNDKQLVVVSKLIKNS